jgi:hypothetical protein
MNMEGNMKKEKLIKNKKRGQGFAEYALLAGGIIIIVGIALATMRGIFNNVGSYIRCLLRVATVRTQEAANINFGGCNICLRENGQWTPPNTEGGDFCN